VTHVLVAALVSLVVSLLGTPATIRLLRERGYGQLIRDDGPTTHHIKRGTPTMGGTVILAATLLGYAAAHLFAPYQFTASGLLVLFLMTGMGLVGFADDYIKVRKQRSLGLSARAKLVGQLGIGLVFAVLALRFPNGSGLTPGSTHLSFVRDSAISLSPVGFVLIAYIIVSGASNGVNLTDGLDGLATGACVMVFGAYVVVAFWEFGNACTGVNPNCYQVRDPLDLAIVAAAAMGACFGFLWWNAPPARIFMGDTGSLSLGGALAGLAICTRTQLLLILFGGLFVVITLSVIIQVAAYKVSGRRVFKMAPLQHHFELSGWAEVTIVIRFWIIAGLAVAFGLGVFYADFVARGSLL
jgi:phospho-N-acetylmuramoyl-pentapeptide-transferase